MDFLETHNDFISYYVEWEIVGGNLTNLTEHGERAFDCLLNYLVTEPTTTMNEEVHCMAMSWMIWFDRRMSNEFTYSRALMKRYVDRQEMDMIFKTYPHFRREFNSRVDNLSAPNTTASAARLDSKTMI